MAMKKCKECDEMISSSTSKCIKCGKDQRNWFSRHKVLTVIIVFVVFIIGIAGSDDSTSTTTTTSSEPGIKQEVGKTETKPAKEPVEEKMSYEIVKALSFIEEFDNNQLSAEKKYENKGVQITAKISNISEDILGNPFLSLEPANAGEYYFGTNIQCMFESEDALLEVSNDQVVTIKGIVGEQTLGIIGIDECVIIE